MHYCRISEGYTLTNYEKIDKLIAQNIIQLPFIGYTWYIIILGHNPQIKFFMYQNNVCNCGDALDKLLNEDHHIKLIPEN